MPAGLSFGEAGWSSCDVFAKYRDEEFEMRKSMTDRTNDGPSWAIGVMEPIVLLMILGIIAVVMQLL
jgi:hypothetical protein